ncbi:hypothetical protein PaeCFBP13512_18375 [Paenibacillus sp. CFBP13512]|uniref:hypothetical protein n=1 Tax=Paenibacillus sp. CFBP13512 TaxID=2184007 RepID=UPI0010BFCF3A|nr:hypothetical protein [Paenibacillus sp. CFBP13512]TKJ87189.1 hypothetical protein PaeCFBP13512_18375 [Paenibacillus sp. CFBP13512]
MESKICLEYRLNSGIKKDVYLTKEQLVEWMQCYKTNTRFVVQIDKDVHGISPHLVATFEIKSTYLEKSELQLLLNSETEEMEEMIEPEKCVFYITCSCGANYYRYHEIDRRHLMCLVCRQKQIFADYSVGVVEGAQGIGYSMTNLKFVDRNLTRPPLIDPNRT